MDKFVQFTESSPTCNASQPALFFRPGLVMDYYDGNTVTGLWNYAQHYAMSDNNWDTPSGPPRRLPMVMISPWTRQNYVSGKLTNTVSITSFIEDNWLRGQRIGNGSYDTVFVWPAVAGRSRGRAWVSP